MDRSRTLVKLQAQQSVWADRNFGDCEVWHPFAGIVEEVGELCRALDALPSHSAIVDAIADSVIYMAHFCTLNGWELNYLYVTRQKYSSIRPYFWTVELGKLAHGFLKREQGIRGDCQEHNVEIRDALRGLLGLLHWTAMKYDVDLIETTWRVWDTVVSKRDWLANPNGEENV